MVICTYNGKNRLVETLIHLIKQNANIDWEIVFVDNASVDNTLEFIIQWWAENGNKDIPIMFLSQPRPGKQYAQELGYDKANYEYLLVCDDDNWLCDTYIQTAFEIMEENDQIGALGGRSEAKFENGKPDWFDNFASKFAVAKQGEKSGDITDKKGALFGAGMITRKSIWHELKKSGFEPVLNCLRTNNELIGGEDIEYSFALRLWGKKIWYDERLLFYHFMPASRMTLEYLKRLNKAINKSEFILTAYIDALRNQPISLRFYIRRQFSFFRKGLLRSLKRIFSRKLNENERGKSFFRSLILSLFGFRQWKSTRLSIKSWTHRNEANLL